MKYEGSCHCKAVKFEVDAEFKEVLSCNCSICIRRGHLLSFMAPTQFKLFTDEKALTDYQWGKKSIHFMFCSTCGCAPFGKGESPDGPMMAVNVRCLEGVDIQKIPVTHFDGRHLI